jgi:GntR family transcriptional repressor for pyruvate dehydrogenase complex
MGTKIERRTLAEQVAEGIASYILAQQLNVGDSLPSAAKLSKEFEVSRPVVREALKTLEARGMIKIQNGKPATVSPITSSLLRDYFDQSLRQRTEAVIELLELRKGIEVQGAYLAAQRRTVDDLDKMHAILRAMRAAVEDQEQYAELDTQLHLAVMEASHNHMLFHLAESIRALIKDTIREGLNLETAQQSLEITQPGHERIIGAIEQGDAGLAASLMSRHMDGALAKMHRLEAQAD